MGDSDDRTIPATPRRRELARRQGGMPLAHQPAWAAAAATTVLLLPTWARATFPAATDMMRGALAAAAAEGPTAPFSMPSVPPAVFAPTAALVIAAGVVGLTVRLTLDGGGWRPSRAAPSFDRISLIGGLARIFSMRTAVLTGTGAAALAAVTTVAALAAGPLVAAIGEPATASEPMLLVAPLRYAIVAVAAATVLLAACQWIMARLRFERRIRMTPQEYADEARSMQAAPQVRLLQRRAATRPAAANSATGLRSAVPTR